MSTINKTSIRVPSQLPSFINDDINYETFVAFLQAYYEWLELPNAANAASTVVSTVDMGNMNEGPTSGLKNLSKYFDIDKTLDGFIQYYINDFLPYFPEDALSDKSKVLKIARQLYKTKGTPASYKLLFRLLYNSDAEILYTGELLLRASSGQWYIPEYLKVKSDDQQWISKNVKNLRLFGIQSKSFAVIENAVSTTSPSKFNIYISQMERLFVSGETVKIVDSRNQDIYFLNGEVVPAGTPDAIVLTGKLVGSISTISIDRNYRGLKYKAGDPVVVYGGLAEPTANGAKAFISETTTGSIQRLNISKAGHGYRPYPNSSITFTGGGGIGAIAHISTIDPTESSTVTLLASDSIALRAHLRLDADEYNFTANAQANVYCSIANAMSMLTFVTHPIDSIIVENGGGGYIDIPRISAQSLYNDEIPSNTLWLKNGQYYTSNVAGSVEISSSNTHMLESAGILSPIQFTANNTTGFGYRVNDKIVFSGGQGVGAFANVSSVDSKGTIQSIAYVSNYLNDKKYPLGGMGYTNNVLPNVTIQSANTQAYGASIYVPGVLGTGAVFNASTDRIGSITKISISQFGEDYVSTPNVSFKVQDLVVTNVSGDISSIVPGTMIYQGIDADEYTVGAADLEQTTYLGYFDSVTLAAAGPTNSQNIYIVRVYDYVGIPDYNIELQVDTEEYPYPTMKFTKIYDGTDPLDATSYHNGIKTYGDSTARGAASFLNGLIFGQGRYLTTAGQPSSYSVLQSSDYNDFTYILSVEAPIAKYKDIIKKLLHPSGTKVLGRDILRNSKTFRLHGYPGNDEVKPLQTFIDWPVGDRFSTVTIQTTGQLANSMVKVVNAGTGYNPSTTTVYVSPPDLPNGTQATAQAKFSNGTISSVVILNPGSGYTSPFISILDATTRTGNSNANISVYATLSTNKIKVNSKVGANIFNNIIVGDYVVVQPTYGPPISSKVASTDVTSNTITMQDECWLTFPNVAYGYADSTTDGKIQVSKFSIANTPNYDIVNSKKYSNTQTHIVDIVFIGDNITIGGSTYVVTDVDYNNSIISIVNAQGFLGTESKSNTSSNTVITESGADSNGTTGLKNLLLGEILITIGSEQNPVPFTINRTITTASAFLHKHN